MKRKKKKEVALGQVTDIITTIFIINYLSLLLLLLFQLISHSKDRKKNTLKKPFHCSMVLFRACNNIAFQSVLGLIN